MFLWYIFQHSETTLISKSLGEWFLSLYASILKLQGPVFLWKRKNYFEETSHFCMNIKFHPIQQSISHAVNSLPFVTVSIRTRAYIIFSIFPCIDSVWGLRCCTGLGTGYYPYRVLPLKVIYKNESYRKIPTGWSSNHPLPSLDHIQILILLLKTD